MKRFGLNIVNILLLSIFLTMIIVPFFADMQFNTAQKLEKNYRWKKAASKYELAIKLDSFNTKYFAGYADFCANQSSYHKDKVYWLTRAEELYKRALQLNPRCSEYYFNLGQVQIMYYLLFSGNDSKNTKNGAKTYIREAIKNFRQAVKDDPQGFNISFSVGEAGMSFWEFLDDRGRRTLSMKR